MAEPTAANDASMEISSAEAPTTVDCFTQTEPVKVCRLVSRRMKIKTKDLIALDKLTFTHKKNIQVREGHDIHGPNGAATRAKQRCVKKTDQRYCEKRFDSRKDGASVERSISSSRCKVVFQKCRFDLFR